MFASHHTPDLCLKLDVGLHRKRNLIPQWLLANAIPPPSRILPMVRSDTKVDIVMAGDSGEECLVRIAE